MTPSILPILPRGPLEMLSARSKQAQPQSLGHPGVMANSCSTVLEASSHLSPAELNSVSSFLVGLPFEVQEGPGAGDVWEGKLGFISPGAIFSMGTEPFQKRGTTPSLKS